MHFRPRPDLGCEHGMGPDLLSAARAAIARVVGNLKAEHGLRVSNLSKQPAREGEKPPIQAS